jgi:putative FmdB family regulatory protein
MPTYEYICTKCQHKFEIYQSIKDDALDVCPREKCGRKSWGKGKVKRVIGGGAGIIFKGSGFYITDYRSESYKTAAKKETETKSSAGSEKAGSSSSGKTESKVSSASSTKAA